ncbi:amino acid ABC transporter permease [Mariniluteicoccus endophyticus]
MSVQAVLFDAPGPKGRARNRVLSIVSAVVIVLALVGFVWGMSSQLVAEKWAPFAQPETWTQYIVPGLMGTLQAAGISVLLAGVLGIVLGAARLSHNAVIRVPASIFIEFFRAVPVLMMMLFSYYVYLYAGLFSGFMLTLAGVVTGLTFYNACVIAELIRSGVHSLPKGQREAGLAIGLTQGQTLSTILLPQAITAMLPSLVSQLVVVLKDSALGYMISYAELLRAGQTLASVQGNLIVTFIVIGALFVIVNWLLTVVARWLEKRMAKRTSGRLDMDDLAALNE